MINDTNRTRYISTDLMSLRHRLTRFEDEQIRYADHGALEPHVDQQFQSYLMAAYDGTEPVIAKTRVGWRLLRATRNNRAAARTLHGMAQLAVAEVLRLRKKCPATLRSFLQQYCFKVHM